VANGPLRLDGLDIDLDVSGDIDIPQEDSCETMSFAIQPHYKACDLSVFTSVTTPAAHLRAELSLAGVPGVDRGVVLELETLKGEVQGSPVELSRSVSFSLDDEGYRLRPLELEGLGGDWIATLRGRWGSEHRFEFLLRDFEFTSTLVAEFLGTRASQLLKYDPNVTLDVVLSGDAYGGTERGWPATISAGGAIDLDRGSFRLGGVTHEGVGGRVELELNDEALEIEIPRIDCGADRLVANLRLPVEWVPYPSFRHDELAQLSVRGRVRDVGRYVRISSKQIREVRGNVDVFVEASAWLDNSLEPQSPTIDVGVQMRDGSLKLAGDFPTLEKVRADARLRDRVLTLDEFSAALGGKRLSVRGEATFSEPASEGGVRIESFHFGLRGQRALLVRKPELRVRGDLDLDWSGQWERSRLSGTVKLGRSYYLRDVAIVSGGADLPLDWFRLEHAPLSQARLDIRVRADRSLQIKNNLVDTKASVDLRIRGTGREPLITGTISCDSGTVSVGNNRLDIRSAIIEITERDPFHPQLQVLLGARLGIYDVTVTVTGPSDAPEVVLASTPPLDNDRLLVLVTTGYTPEQIDERGIGRVAALEAAKYLGSSLLSYLYRDSDRSKGSFLDDLSIETETRRYSNQSDLFRVEYRVRQNIFFEDLRDEVFVQGERDFYGDYNVNLGWRFEVR
ncbi:MAG: translocation/assembly module TamB domain-containing protein, partial [Planctomycetota bacterium]